MRTTVEITEAQRGELLRLAAQRGEKGFSALVREAIDLYLAQSAQRQEAIRAALEVQGSLTDDEAREMTAAIRQSRERWR